MSEDESFEIVRERFLRMLGRIVESDLPFIDRDSPLSLDDLMVPMIDNIQTLRRSGDQFRRAAMASRYGLGLQAFFQFNCTVFFDVGKIFTPKGWISF